MLDLSEHRVPLVVSSLALLVAVGVGLIPVFQNRTATVEATIDNVDAQMESLEQRLQSIENTAPAPAPVAAAAPASLSRISDEVALLNKGVVNQMRRVSALKAQMSQYSNFDPNRLQAEMALINRALITLSRKSKALRTDVDGMSDFAKRIDRLELQMSNTDRAFTQLLKKTRSAADEPAAADVDMDEIKTLLNAIQQKIDSGS